MVKTLSRQSKSYGNSVFSFFFFKVFFFLFFSIDRHVFFFTQLGTQLMKILIISDFQLLIN